jgi:hypothetical protein
LVGKSAGSMIGGRGAAVRMLTPHCREQYGQCVATGGPTCRSSTAAVTPSYRPRYAGMAKA